VAFVRGAFDQKLMVVNAGGSDECQLGTTLLPSSIASSR